MLLELVGDSGGVSEKSWPNEQARLLSIVFGLEFSFITIVYIIRYSIYIYIYIYILYFYNSYSKLIYV